MRARHVVTVALLAFVAVTIGAIVVQALQEEEAAPKPAAAGPSAAPQPAPGPKVLALYLHFTRRCPTCMKIESYAEEAVRKAFPEEIASGRLAWQSINVEDPGNLHFLSDYGMTSQSVVLVEREGDRELRWRKLDRIWDLVGDKVAFQDYVRDEVRAFLAGQAEKNEKKG